MAFRFFLTIALVASVALCQQNDGIPSRFPQIPGVHTAAGVLASSTDEMARLLAPNGPIQPAITAAAHLPVQAADKTNQGMTRISSNLHGQAETLSRTAGDGGNIRMPGLEALETRIQEPLSAVGERIKGTIRGNSNFLREQANNANAAMNRLSSETTSSAQDFLAKRRSQMQNQMNSASEELKRVRDFGDDVRSQAQGIAGTLRNGAQGAIGELRKTGQDVVSQLQNNQAKNTSQMSNMLGSLRGSMGSNLDSLRRSAQSAAQQVTSSVQRAAHMPMDILSNLGNRLNSGLSSGTDAAKNMVSLGRY